MDTIQLKGTLSCFHASAGSMETEIDAIISLGDDLDEVEDIFSSNGSLIENIDFVKLVLFSHVYKCQISFVAYNHDYLNVLNKDISCYGVDKDILLKKLDIPVVE